MNLPTLPPLSAAYETQKSAVELRWARPEVDQEGALPWIVRAVTSTNPPGGVQRFGLPTSWRTGNAVAIWRAVTGTGLSWAAARNQCRGLRTGRRGAGGLRGEV